MKKTIFKIKIALGVLALFAWSQKVIAQQKILPESLNTLGTENGLIAQRIGLWDVTETVWPAPGAQPIITSGLVAERRMTGSMLQEFLYAGSDSIKNKAVRTDMLTFNRIEGRWTYVSYDARVTIGLMPAWSNLKGDGKTIELSFFPFALPGSGKEISGQLLRMDETISFSGQDNEVKDQYFTLADGTATRWLAHRYAYVRRIAGKSKTPAAGQSSKIDEIRKRGTLRVAVLDEYPWLKATHNGDIDPPYEGPAWTLAEEYAGRLGVRLETIPVNFEGKLSVLKNGEADISIAPLLVTPERIKTVDMVSYSVSAQTLFGRAGNFRLNRITSIDQLDRPDITVASIEGSPQGKWLMERLPKAKHLLNHGNLADVPLDPILKGKADVANIDNFFFADLADKNPGLISIPNDYMSSTELPIPIGLAIYKGQPVFLNWLKSVADEIKLKVRASETAVINNRAF